MGRTVDLDRRCLCSCETLLFSFTAISSRVFFLSVHGCACRGPKHKLNPTAHEVMAFYRITPECFAKNIMVCKDCRSWYLTNSTVYELNQGKSHPTILMCWGIHQELDQDGSVTIASPRSWITSPIILAMHIISKQVPMSRVSLCCRQSASGMKCKVAPKENPIKI